MKRAILIVGAVLIAAIVVAGFLVWRTLDDTDPVTATDALAEYRESPTPGRAAPGLPAPGVYEYGVTGSERLSRGPFDIDRTLPEIAPMLVRHAAGGYETDLRYSEDHTELSRYALRPPGAFVTFARTVVGIGTISTTRERDWTPPLLRLPLRPEVGQDWGGPYAAGDLRLQIRNEVVRLEVADVGGTRVDDVFVIESRQRITGEYSGRRTETFWYSPSTGMVVEYSIESSLDGPTDIDITARQTLRSLTPQA